MLDDIMHYFQIALFILGGLFIVILCFGICEMIAVRLFYQQAYDIGIIKYNKTIPRRKLNTNNHQHDSIILTDNGKFKFVDGKVCLFCQRMWPLEAKSVTPLQLKGKITYDNDIASVEGRIPLGTTMFFGLFLLTWNFFSILIVVVSTSFLNTLLGVIFFIIGWMFPIWQYYSCMHYEKQLVNKMIDELNNYLSKGSSPEK